jgi:hypothetical protein
MQGIPKIGKHVSVSQIIEKYKVVGSVARMLLNNLTSSGAVNVIEKHSKQGLFSPAAVAEKPIVQAATTETTKKNKGAEKKK